MYDKVNSLVVRARLALSELREENGQRGQAMVEYALILGLISVVAIVTLGLIGTDVNDILVVIEAKLNAVTP